MARADVDGATDENAAKTEQGQLPHRLTGVAVLLWVVMPLVAAVGWFWFVMKAFNFDGCEDDCLLPLLYTAYRMLPWSLVASFAVAILVAAVLAIRRRRTVWGPVVGMVMLAVTLVGMHIVTEVGFAPMFERNARLSHQQVSTAVGMPPHRDSSVVARMAPTIPAGSADWRMPR